MAITTIPKWLRRKLKKELGDVLSLRSIREIEGGQALKILTHPDFLGISPRRISLSTVGIIPGIRRLTKEFSQINLAFSLHCPFEYQRRRLMPISKIYPIEKVFAVLDETIVQTNRRVFIAYLLLRGVNDSPAHAQALAELIKAKGRQCYLYHVNLIRYHPGPSLDKFKTPTAQEIKNFIKVLERNNISWSLRQSFGQKIFAACGQLYGGYRYER